MLITWDYSNDLNTQSSGQFQARFHDLAFCANSGMRPFQKVADTLCTVNSMNLSLKKGKVNFFFFTSHTLLIQCIKNLRAFGGKGEEVD